MDFRKTKKLLPGVAKYRYNINTIAVISIGDQDKKICVVHTSKTNLKILNRESTIAMDINTSKI